MANLQDLLEKDIFELLHIANISEQQKESMIQKMNETIQARVTTRIASMLSDEDAQEFGQLAEKNDEAALQALLSKNKVDMASIAQEEALRFRIELVEMLDVATQNQPIEDKK